MLVKLFGPATESTRTCAPLSSFSPLLHTSELVFCGPSAERTPPGRTDGRTDGWDGGWRQRGQKAPFQAAFSNLSGSESVQNPVSTWQALHIILIKSEKSLISICLIDKLLLDELISSTFFSVQACSFPTPL